MKLKHELNNISGAVSVLIDLVRKPVDMSTSCLVMGPGDEFFTMKFDDLSQCIYGALSPTPPIEIQKYIYFEKNIFYTIYITNGIQYFIFAWTK